MSVSVKEKKQNGVNIREVYQLVEHTREELTASIIRLETKFDALEVGRLSSLEIQFNTIRSEIEPLKKVIYGFIGLLLVTFVGTLLGLILK